MADPTLGGEPHAASSVVTLMAKAIPYAPGFAGAVLSLAFVENLTIRGRVVCVAVGLGTAVYLGPAFAAIADLVWPGDMPIRVQRGIEFLTALSAMGCLPPLLAYIKRVAGDPLSLLKVRIGPPAPPSGGA